MRAKGNKDRILYEVASGEMRCDGTETQELQWFTLDELPDNLHARDLLLFEKLLAGEYAG